MRKENMKELLCGCTPEAQGAMERLLHGQGFCAAKPDITVAGKAFCFTGRSQRASREAMAEAVRALGGTFMQSVSRRTDYLVVCSGGNTRWAHTTYGNKIRHAAHIKSEGGRPRIVREEDFWRACEAMLSDSER